MEKAITAHDQTWLPRLLFLLLVVGLIGWVVASGVRAGLQVFYANPYFAPGLPRLPSHALQDSFKVARVVQETALPTWVAALVGLVVLRVRRRTAREVDGAGVS